MVFGRFVGIREQAIVAVTKGNAAEIGHEQQSVTAEIEITMQGLAHHAAHVGTVRVGPAFMELARYGGTTDVVVFLEDDNFQTSLGEIGRVRQAVVARTDNDGVVIAHRNISCAALWPGAPVSPPPGCEPAPHKYNPGIGVLYWAASYVGRIMSI